MLKLPLFLESFYLNKEVMPVLLMIPKLIVKVPNTNQHVGEQIFAIFYNHSFTFEIRICCECLDRLLNRYAQDILSITLSLITKCVVTLHYVVHLHKVTFKKYQIKKVCIHV